MLSTTLVDFNLNKAKASENRKPTTDNGKENPNPNGIEKEPALDVYVKYFGYVFKNSMNEKWNELLIAHPAMLEKQKMVYDDCG